MDLADSDVAAAILFEKAEEQSIGDRT